MCLCERELLQQPRDVDGQEGKGPLPESGTEAGNSRLMKFAGFRQKATIWLSHPVDR